MSKLHTILAALLGASSVLVSAGAVQAQTDATELRGVFSGAVSERTQAQLASGGRASVIVMMDVSVDEMLAAAEDDPEGDYLAARLEQSRQAVLREAFPQTVLAQRGSESAELGYEAFRVTPGFTVNANASEIAALRRAPGVVGVYDNLRYQPMTDTSVALIGAPALWDMGVTGAGVSVAVLDTGVEKDHPMIGPAIIASACYNTSVEGESSSLCPNGEDEQISFDTADAGDSCLDSAIDSVNGIDGCYHGTHVASTVAGRPRFLSGGGQVVGVARAADIVAINTFSRVEPAECVDEGETPNGPCVRAMTSDLIAALDWLIVNKTRFNLAAVNMSLGGSEAYAAPCYDYPYDRTMQALTQQGVAVVVAAGNDGFANGLSSPACIRSAISVGAVNDTDQVASFSNDADYLDLLAPGVDILAAFGSEQITPGAECLNGATANAQGWCYYYANSDGTSMATPHVAGAFAQLRQAYPSATVEELLNAFKVTGEPIVDGATERVHARIQVDAAYYFLSNNGIVRSVSLDSQERYDARNTSNDIASFNQSVRTIRNTSGQSRTIRVVSKPSWLTTEFFYGTGGPSGAAVSQSQITLDADGQIRLSINDAGLEESFNSGVLLLAVDDDPTPIRLKVTALVTTSLWSGYYTLRFGPFEWVGDADQSVGSIFRIVGLDSGMPVGISADIERWGARDGQSVQDSSIRCDFTVRPNRYSGNEYIIGAADFADCPRFDRGDLFIDVRVVPEDQGGVNMRRFLFNASGGITDSVFDPVRGYPSDVIARGRDVTLAGTARLSELSHQEATQPQGVQTPQAISSKQFGPFEWTYDANGELRSEFRLGPIQNGDFLGIDVAIANASAAGYNGDFDDCSLTIRPGNRGENDYQIWPEDLADCGAFGRADLTFRVSADTTRLNSTDGDIRDMRMQRFIRRTSGSLTDLYLDEIPSNGVRVTDLGNGSGQVIVGPFEWTGDSTTPTSNQFRIAGVANGSINRIDVAIANATAAGYTGDYADCSLTIRPARAGANDYIIQREDLADCGNFGRGDLTFRIQGPVSAFNSFVKVRRLAFGAQGDITDFSFDVEEGEGEFPSLISADVEEVVFGPFEWVGDANAGTQGVFRITGIVGGLPGSIEVAIANASAGNGAYIGAYSDCSINLRPSRAGLNEYVIGAVDFADCGDFGRGDLTFRIRAHPDVLADTVRMRRFAVTASGGLTAFSFDGR